MVENSKSEFFGNHPTSTQFPGGAPFEADQEDAINLMTRPVRSWDQIGMPSPGSRRNSQDDRDRSEGGDFSPDQESDGDYYQMAFIFQLRSAPISKRLFWDVYWPMHRQIANVCGVSIDELVGVHHIRHPPRDLTELDVQSVIAQKAEEVSHGEGTVLILADTERHSVSSMRNAITVREVRKINKYISREGVLVTFEILGECQQANRPCLVWINNGLWKQQSVEVRELYHGDYIRCAVPDREVVNCEDTEEYSMVQLHVATQTEGSVDSGETKMDIELYGMGQDYTLLDEIEPDIRCILDELEEIWDVDRSEVVALHEVKDPPIHRQKRNVAIYLIEKREDGNTRGRADDVMTLTEVIIKGSQMSGDRIRKLTVLWMRRRARRIQVLSQLRIDGFCDREGVFECKVYYNNVYWPEADYAIRQFLDGDAIWIEIQMEHDSARTAIMELETIEIGDRARRLFSSGPVRQPDEEPSEERGSTHSERTGERSRSRSRQQDSLMGGLKAPGSVEDATWDLEDHLSEACEGLVMLQTGRKVFRKVQHHEAKISFVSIPPPGNPGQASQESCVEYYELSDQEEDQQDTERTTCRMTTDVKINEMWKLFQPWRKGVSVDIVIDDNALQFLSGCVAGWDEDIQELHVYTDGSYQRNSDLASFAFAVFGWNRQTAHKHFFVGWTGGIVSLDPHDRNFVGANSQSANDGEASAIIWALMWILQSGHWRPCHIHFDSTTAGFTATGAWHFDQRSLIKRKMRELVQVSQEIRPGMLQFHHVKAHSGQPCNELVDGFAKQMIKEGRKNAADFPSWKPLFTEGANLLAWSWWFVKGIHRDSGMPSLQNDGYSWEKQMECGLGEVQPFEIKENKEEEFVTYSLRIASYNAMTLRDKETDKGQRGEDWKAASLRSQFSERGYHFIGLQETRATNSTVISTPDYVRFVSGGQDGHHGCELWCHKNLKIGGKDGHPMTINPQTCTVLHAEPRLLVVSVGIEGTRVIFYVMHVPHEGTEENARNDWWTHTKGIFHKFMNMGKTFILADLNARFGEEVQGIIGNRLCTKSTNNGDSFIEVLEDIDGWLPSTFSEYHDGQDWTWTHPRGSKARLDYIALEKASNMVVRKSWVDLDIQTSLTVRDHEVVGMDLDLLCGLGNKTKHRTRYDWEKLHTKEGRLCFQQIVNELPEEDWKLDIHTHWQRLENGLHKGLSKHFPVQKKGGRRNIFSANTLGALELRKKAKKVMDLCDEVLDQLDLRSGFMAWKDGTSIQNAGTTSWLCQLTLVLCHLQAIDVFRLAARQVRNGTKTDKAGFIESVADRAESARGVDIFKELRPLRIGGKFRKRGQATLPGFILDGEQAVDHIHNEHLWLKHCSKLEAGVVTSTSKLLQRARRGALQRLASLDTPFRLEDAPTLTMLEEAFRRVQRSKAGGLDSLTSDVCVAAPKELAAKFFPALIKMLSMIEEPIQMKGGLLTAAFKGGVQNDPADHRSLLLSSHLGKALRRVFRQQIIQQYAQSAPETFFSIRTGGNVSHASLALRLFCNAAVTAGESTGVLFLDVKSAYYRVVRQLAVGGSGVDSIERVMAHFDIGATDLQELMEELHGTPEARVSNLTQHQELMLEELLSSTWFTGQHRSMVMESMAGSRPGDGMADVIFGFIFKRILRRVTNRLRDTLQIEEVEINGDLDLTSTPTQRVLPSILQVVWADDLAVCYKRRGASKLAEEMAEITSVVFGECLRHGLIPNLKRGKTELLLLFKGEGSRGAKAAHFNQTEPRIYIPNVPEDFQWVNLAHTYRHLGTKVHISLKLLPEIKSRCGQAGQIFRKHRKQVFQNPRISLRRRTYLMASMVMSILEYNTGTWGRLSVGEWTYFRKKVYALYRGIARATIPEEKLRIWNQDKVLAFLQLPSPEIIIHVSRLRFMTSLWRSAPNTLLHLIGAEGQWLQELQKSQAWMEDQLKGYGPDRHGHPWRPPWDLWKQEGGCSMKNWIRKAKQYAVIKHARTVDWREFHFEFVNDCIEAGWQHPFPWPTGQSYEDGQAMDACLACGVIFKNKTGWAVHAFKVHGRTAPKRLVIGGTRCDACAREYRSTAKFLMHLRHSDICYRRLVQAGKVYQDVLPGIGSRQEAKPGPMPIPVLPSEGPSEEAFQQVAPAAIEDYDTDFIEGILDCLLEMKPGINMDEGLEQLKLVACRSFSSFRLLKKTLDYMAAEIEKEEAHLEWQIPGSLVEVIVKTAARRFKLSWFFPAEQIKAPVDDGELREAAWQYCKKATGPWQWAVPDYIPRFGCRILIWLHLFSGERRGDDLQSHLERLQAPSGYVMRILSVDVIFDKVAGNLACPRNQEVWLQNIDRGFVAGLMAGPPCESWSRARVHGGVAGWSTGDDGPRVLRTLEYPEGLDSMTIKELQQTHLGNILLCFTMKAFLRMVKRRRFAMLEHPKESEVEEEFWLASIWRLFLTRALQCHSFVKKEDLLQGWYGAKSPKPTTLLFSAGPKIDIKNILIGMRTVDVLPGGLKMGFNRETKEFQTASLKNYPGGLCAAISAIAQCWLNHYLPVNPCDDAPQGFAEFVQYSEKLVQAFNFDAMRGADFHH